MPSLSFSLLTMRNTSIVNHRICTVEITKAKPIRKVRRSFEKRNIKERRRRKKNKKKLIYMRKESADMRTNETGHEPNVYTMKIIVQVVTEGK